MSEQFPIRLVCDEANQAWVGNLEAWINFETLKAQWFVDEQRIVDCELRLCDEALFTEQFSRFEGEGSIALEDHGIGLHIEQNAFLVRGILRIDNDSTVPVKKQLKLRLKKAFVLIAPSLALPAVF